MTYDILSREELLKKIIEVDDEMAKYRLTYDHYSQLRQLRFRLLRSLSKMPKVPIVGMEIPVEPEPEEEHLEKGIDDYGSIE